jgi:hypothetical protein
MFTVCLWHKAAIRRLIAAKPLDCWGFDLDRERIIRLDQSRYKVQRDGFIVAVASETGYGALRTHLHATMRAPMRTFELDTSVERS